MDDEIVLKPTPKAKASSRKGPGSDAHDDLVEFVLLAIKAAIHHFLFQRKVYPERWFKSERVFLTYTQACRHPAVREYISEATGSIKTEERPPWEDIDDALRGLLLQLHHCNFVLPPAKEGVSFRIAVQTQQKATLPEPHWALYEDPTAAAIAAARAPPAQYSQAEPEAPGPRRSASGGNTAPLDSLQSPYNEPQHGAQHGTQSTAVAAGAASQVDNEIDHPFAPSDAPPPAAPRRAAHGGRHSSPPEGAPGLERMHEVGFGSGGGACGGLQPPPWDSQQSQGVQSQTQRPDHEQASNSTQRPAESLRNSQAVAGPSESETADRGGHEAGVTRRRPDKRRRSSAGDDGAGPAAKAALTAAEAAAASAGGPPGDDWSPLLVALREEGPHEDSRRPSKGDTESYGNDGCQPFQAAQIVPLYSPEEVSPAACTHSRSGLSEDVLGDPADSGSPAGSEGDTVLEGASPKRNPVGTHPDSHAVGASDSPLAVVVADVGTPGVPAPRLAARGPHIGVAHIGLTASGVSGSLAQGDTLIEDAADAGGAGVAPSGAGGRDEEATSPCESPGEPAPEGGASAGADDGGDAADAGCAAGQGGSGPGGGGALQEGSEHASLRRSDDGTEGDALPGQGRPGLFWDGEPDYFADMMGSEGGLFRGFGQRVEAAVSPSAASDGREDGEGGASGCRSPGSDVSQPSGMTASPPEVEPGSSDVAVGDQDILPGVAAAEMLLKPLVDTCIPGVLAIRANVLHLRRPLHP